MARKPRPTLADYAVIGISPALIMFLIGSLVFFLITVFYQGQFDVRLSFIMAMFIMAAVSIARISIEQGREYASLFALPLAGVTLFAMFRFVELGGAFARLSMVFNVGLIALIWYFADKLTWDCTVIDENQDQSGQGLLQTGGMNDDQPAAEAASDDPREPPAPVASGLWQRFVEHRRRPHAPGIWVIYFSVAALPIFGFGQWFVRDEVSRRYAFKLLVVFVASALGLLLTTSFLGLRRYLRQRRLEMPVEMAGTWLGVGATMIVALLLICMLMPRRNAEYSVSDLSFLKSRIELPVSDWAVGNDGQDQDQAARQVKRDDADQTMEGQQGAGGRKDSQQGQGGEKSKSGEGQSNEQNSKSKSPGGSQGQDSQGQDNQGQDNQAQDNQAQDSQDQDSQDQDSSNAEKNSSATPQDQSDNQKSQNPRGKKQGDQPQGGKQGKQPEQSPPPEQVKPGQQASPPEQEPAADQQPSESKTQAQSQQSAAKKGKAASKPRSSPAQLFNKLSPTLGGLLKALYWLLAIVVVAYLLWKNWEKVKDAVANFVKAMQDLWARLFGGRAHDGDAEEAEAAAPVRNWRPFADFVDPFAAGRADTMPIAELIGYTFQAFEAWGREHGCARLAEQTPIEFAKAAVRQHGALGKEAMRVEELYNWTAFGKTAVPDANREHLRRFWHELRAEAVV